MSLPANQDLLKLFGAYLSEAGLSSISVKNYLSDLRHFLAFCNTQDIREGKSTEEIFQSISKYVTLYSENQKTNFTPTSSINRRLASIRRFSTFLKTTFGVKENEVDHNVSPSSIDTTSPSRSTSYGFSNNTSDDQLKKVTNQFKSYLEKGKKSHSTVKNYLSDVNHYIAWSANQTPYTSQKLEKIISSSQLSTYVTYEKLSHTSTSVINRRQSSIKKFAQFCFENNYLPANPFEKKTQVVRLAPLAWLERLSKQGAGKDHQKKEEKSSKLAVLYQQYNSLPFTPYLHLAILVLATSAMAIFAYNQIIKAAFPSLAATPPVVPNRQLSFQGRLTDSSNNPITAAVNVTFRLFDQSTSGTQLYTTGACSISPDQNGIFNTLIGNGVCGSAIPATVFSNNRDVFIEIQVASETLTPRQQIATVGYALNSDTLQGYPASASATANTVPVMNSDGNIVLAQLNPSIVATGSTGTFTVRGQTLSLQTTAGSGGNIILQPDTAGAGNVQVLTSAATGNQFRVSDANLTTGTLISGYSGNNNDAPGLLVLSSGSTETEKFAVRADGQTRITTDNTLVNAALMVNQLGSGDLFTASQSGATKFVIKNDGKVGIGLTNPTYPLDVVGNINSSTGLCIAGDCRTAWSAITGVSYWNWNTGVLSPVSVTDAVNLGNAATNSATVHLPGINTDNAFINAGNFGIGTTSPTAKLQVVGDSYISGNLAIGNTAPIGVTDVSGGSTSAGSALADAKLSEFAGYIDSPFASFGEYQNYLQQTEAFATTWTQVSLSAGIVSNSAVDPRGTVLAENIPAGTTGAGEVNQTITDSSTGNWTFSVWLKAQSGTPTIQLRIDSNAETGTALNIPLTTAWKRYSVTQNLTLANANKTVHILNGTNAIAAFGAQFEPLDHARRYSGAITTTPVTAITRTAYIPSSITTLGNLAISGSLSGATTGAFSSAVTITRTSLATTSTDGLVVQNNTAATAGVPVQYSPRLRLSGTVYDTGAAASRTTNFINEVVPSSGNPGTANLNWSYDYNGGGYSNLLTLNSGGNLGVGTTTPTAKLDVAGDASTSGSLVFRGTNPATVDILNGDRLDFQTSPGGDTGLAAKMTLTNAGQLGVGLTNPAYTIDAVGSINASVSLCIAGDCRSTWSSVSGSNFWSYNGGVLTPVEPTNAVNLGAVATASATVHLPGVSTDNAFINAGNFGIGTTSPTAKLDVAGDASISGSLVFRGTNPATIDVLNGDRLDFQNSVGGDTGLATRMTLSGANLGIGLTNPTNRLDIIGTSMKINSNSTTYALFDMQSNSTLFRIGKEGSTGSNLMSGSLAGAGILNVQDASALQLGTNNTPRITISSTGNVGVGTATPTALLDVAGDASVSGSLVFRGTNPATIDVLNNDRLDFQTSPSGDTLLAAKMTLTNAGQLGIGVTNPTQSLHVVGNVRVTGAFYDSSNSAGTPGQVLSSTGTGTAWGAAAQNLWQENLGVLAPLHITDDLAVGGTATPSGNPTDSKWQVFANTGDSTQSGSMTLGYNSTIKSAYGPLTLLYKSAANTWTTGITLKDTTGFVGIGTTTPADTLDVNGEIEANGLYIDTAGSVSTPAIRFSTNTGLFYPTTNVIGFVNNGVETARINASGNLGINTQNPGSKLSVQGGASIGSSSYSDIASPTNGAIIEGTVGIGLTNPNAALYKLEVNGNTNIAGTITSSGALTNTAGNYASFTTTPSVIIGATTIGNGGAIGYNSSTTAVWSGSGLPLVFGINGAETYRITSTGQLGYGVTNPAAGTRLQFNLAANELARFNDGTNASALTLLNGSFISTTSTPQFQIAAVGTNPMSFYTGATQNTMTAGTERMRLSAAGGLSLGSTYVSTDPGAGNMIMPGTLGVGTSSLASGIEIDLRGDASISASLTMGVGAQIKSAAGALHFATPGLTADGMTLDRLGATNYANLTVNGQLLPYEDATTNMNLGSGNNTWLKLYLKDGIYDDLGTATIKFGSPNLLSNGNWKVDSGDFEVYNAADLTNLGTITVGNGGGKINVGTVDPPYTINGEKYSTYLPGMIGVKEEVTGKLATTEYVDGVGYRTVLDLTHQPEGSDLWIFSKTTDLEKNIGQLSILLTAQSQARTWYEIDNVKKILAIYSSAPTDISYRMTAPRFDNNKWATYTPNRKFAGLVVNSPDTPVDPDGTILPNYLAEISKVSESVYSITTNGKQNLEQGSFLQLLAANFKAGIVAASEIITENLTVSGKLISPVADIETINTKHLTAQEATVSGTLYADNIQGSTVSNLSNKLSVLGEQYSTASAILADLQAKYSNYNSLLNPQASTSADILAYDPLLTQTASIPADISLNSIHVSTITTNDLLVNGSLIANSLNSYDTDLYIQPDSSKPVHLLGNLMALLPNGQVVINGDLLISGTLYASAIDTKSATISGQLAIGNTETATVSANKLIALYGDNGSLISSVDASGSADFKQVATSELVIATGNDSAESSSSASTSSNATIGTAIMPANQTEIFVGNTKIDGNTLVYLTPVSDTQNQVLFIKSKSDNQGFTVGINSPVVSPISFNYWIVKTK